MNEGKEKNINLGVTDALTLSVYIDKFNFYLKKMFEIRNIDEGDKLSIDSEGNYYIDKAGWTQKLRRYWYNQGRDRISKVLESDFANLFNTFDKYLNFVKFDEKLSLVTYRKQLVNFNKNIINFLTNTISGLYNLKKTYPKDSEIKVRVDSIIVTLCDLKQKINGLNLLCENATNYQTVYNSFSGTKTRTRTFSE